MMNWFVAYEIVRKGLVPTNITQYELALLNSNLNQEQMFNMQKREENIRLNYITYFLIGFGLGGFIMLASILIGALW